MKLNELAVTRPSKQVSKIFESVFDQKINFDQMSKSQARVMLTRVRSLVKEHRGSNEFYYSEKNPAYLKLMMMEQALASRMSEENSMGSVGAPGTDQQAAQTAMAAGTIATTKDPKLKAALTKASKGQYLSPDEQKLVSGAALMKNENYAGNFLKESEIQQAQVVLAAQDMVDQVQGMLEDVSSLQFKELPALVDSIRNQIGMNQAQQFNSDATAALSGLVQNLQGTKQQLETALGVVTGQETAPVVPGMDAGGAVGQDDIDLDITADADVDADIDDLDDMAADAADDLEEPAAGPELGRKRR
jgi:hypothetical protein